MGPHNLFMAEVELENTGTSSGGDITKVNIDPARKEALYAKFGAQSP